MFQGLQQTIKKSTPKSYSYTLYNKERYTFLLSTYLHVQEGLGSLWNGTKASLMLVSNPAIKFTVYELLKRHYARITGRQVGV